MSFANPAGLWLLALAIPILLLHVLRPRRDEIEVPSVYLWRQIEVSVSGARPWQRLRPSLLLLAQLLAVVGLALAGARPVEITESPVADHTVFIIDASGSMAAHDGDPDRLADAVDEAKELRREIPDGGVASVVVADTRPRVILTQSPDTGSFDDAVESIRTTPGGADFGSAFVLAEGQETGEGDIAFVLLSDGGLGDEEQRLLPPGTTYRSVGDDTTNRAITRLTVEPQGAGLYAVVAVANTGGEDAEQTLRIDVDGRTAVEEEVQLDSDESKDLTFELPAGERVEAFLESEDLLDADDHLYAVAPPRRAVDILVEGPDDVGLCVLMSALAEVERVNFSWAEAGCFDETDAASVLADPPVTAETADLIIYNRVPVPAEPPTPFWAIAPPGGVPGGGVAVSGTVDGPVPTLVRSDDALLESIDLSEVLFSEGVQSLEAPTAEVLVGADTNPLLLRGRVAERAFVYTAFGLSGQSTLPTADGFPILGDRIVAELTGAALPPGVLTVGDAIPVDATQPAQITGPGGTRIDVAAGQPAPHADRVGFWTVQPEGQAVRGLAVNPAAGESRLKPAPSLLTPERTPRPGDKPPRGEVSVLAWVVVPLLAVLVAEWLLARRRSGVSRRQFRAATALRVVVALALIGALLDLAIIRHSDRVATIFVVDASDSLGPAGQQEALAWVRDAIESMPSDARAGVALFGGNPRLELTMQSDPVLGPATVEIDRERTDLAHALRMAGSVLPSDAKRRVVLVSDGRPTEGDVIDETAQLEEQGIPVDVHLVERGGGADAAVVDVDVPNRARVGEQVPVKVTIESSESGPAQVSLLADGAVLDEKTVDLVAGQENVVEFLVAADVEGIARFQARVTTATDTVRQNDVGYGAVEVIGTQKVLMVEGREGAGAGLTQALQAGGIAVETVAAAALPGSDTLLTYESVVLVDVPEAALTADQVGDLAAATRIHGTGLVTVGGTQSYGLGGYLDSELEQLLPVVSDILDPRRRQTVSEVLAIDTSGSMGACHCAEGGRADSRTPGGVRKTDIARAGAARAIDALSQSDEVGVLAVDTEDEWVIDLQQLPADEVVSSGLRHINPTGETTNLSTVLTTAADALRRSHTSLKHIILFTDGFVNEQGIFDDLADQAARLLEEDGITVSVLATGEGAAAELEAIATAGGGRFYPGRDLQQIPQILQEEATIASRNFVNEGEFPPVRDEGSALAEEIVPEAPPLLGYIATTAKPQAATHLYIGPDQDPLLASWKVGLGRVTSWTSDGGDRWAQTWTSWEGYVNFWSSVVADTFPPEIAADAVTAHVEDGVLKVRVERSDEAEPFAEGTESHAAVIAPDRTTSDLRLERVGSHAFAGEIPVTAAGTYSVSGQVIAPDVSESERAGSALASLSYSPEYEPGAADPSLLARVSETTGGRGEIQPEQAFDPDDLPSGRSRLDLARWLLLAAALLWPVAVALSRLALRGSVAGQVRHAGATALWWVRARAPKVDRSAPATARPERPVRPKAPEPERREKEKAAAPAASLGSLLQSQRQRRGVADDDPPPP